MKQDMPLTITLIILGLVQFSWLIWPQLAGLCAVISGALIFAVVGATLMAKFSKS